VFFIVGFPGETEEDVRTTLRFAKRLALDFDTANLLFVATPLPGTPLHRQCETEGYFVRDLDNDSLLSAIRLNQTSLIATPEFDKLRLFTWAKEELDVPEICTTGYHMPMILSRSPKAIASFERFLGQDLKGRVTLEYWRLPHNNPPPVARARHALRAAAPLPQRLAV
jgi:hypothetical protein